MSEMDEWAGRCALADAETCYREMSADVLVMRIRESLAIRPKTRDLAAEYLVVLLEAAAEKLEREIEIERKAEA